MQVDIYSDIICPWCYIGEHRFRRALALARTPAIAATFRPFLLDPDAPAEPRPVLEYLQRKFGPGADAAIGNVARIAAQEGLPFRPETQLVVNTLNAHRVLRLALHRYSRETQAELMRALFHAHFAEGANVADHATLAAVAARAAMDAAEVRALLSTDHGMAELQAELAKATELGVRAVPTFVFDGRFALQGAQPVETFLRVLNQVAEGSAPAAPAPHTLH